ncbi:hypothetical protein J2752_001147 [Halarchaeum rubridurum]|uniref:Uncharacterized protein n=1 Tax=Halarchaeum rubridurum TaxID=489911 RepID=A0A830FY93_9EURY|nr:hypothetical protein [Halarchaeum rubridurum]MBP1954266.1 hypothetical protein [Halarchaeum rubridurum]GGM58700.1 hypothetical protein GCM10009017_06000 [Halarchaeum rubridurum]
MADFTARVQRALRDALAERLPARTWETEWYARRTPVDVAGAPDSDGDAAVPRSETAAADAPLVLVEVEMRRADPANNPVKLARYADEGDFERPVVLVQLFSDYYDLETGGVSSKRENAAFVGRLATAHVEGFTYAARDLALSPPKHGADPDGEWESAVRDAADAVTSLLGE